MKNLSFALLILLTTLLIACNKPTSERTVYINTDSIKGDIIADTIIYDVIIKNPNPDDFWTDDCLQYLNKKSFLDQIFANIYNNKLTALDYITGDTLSINDVKNLEQADWYSRESIGKVQFTEIWYFDSKHMVMNKKILNMVFGVEKFNDLDELEGHKPLFRIYMN